MSYDDVSKMIDWYQRVSADQNNQRHRTDELMLAMVAGETVTVLGRRAKFTVEWVDEPPWGSAEIAEQRIAEWLTTLRGSGS